MRAICFDGSRLVLDERAQPPVPGPGEALLRPLRLGVSGFETSLASDTVGEPPRAPAIIGQEFVAQVEALHETADKDLRKKWIGKRVVGSPTIVCSRCDLCRAGLPAHCRARRTLGGNGWNGCFADAFTLPLRNLVEVPAAIDDDRAVFAQALAAALHAAQLVRVEGKPYVTVLGDTVDGLLCAQVLVRLNASVRLLGNNPGRYTLCEKWGIKHRHWGEVGRRGDQDIVVESSGTTAGLDLALGLVRPRGKVVLRDQSRKAMAAPDLSPIVEHEIELLGARNGSVADAVITLGRGEIDVVSLITRRSKLADGPAAIHAAAAPEQLRVLLEP